VTISANSGNSRWCPNVATGSASARRSSGESGSASRVPARSRPRRIAYARPTVFAQTDWNRNSETIPASHGTRTKFQPP